jgi:hypothetical protein
MAERALQLMCRRVASRETFGTRLADHGLVQEWIARSRVEIEQARLLTLKTAWMMDEVGNREARRHIAAIKIVAPTAALAVIDRAVQAHGALGVSQHTPLAEFWAWARTLRILDGPRRGAPPQPGAVGAGRAARAMSTTDTALDVPVPDVPDVDELVRAAVRWHFDSATGSPFWVRRAATLGFDPLTEVDTLADLAMFPNVVDELRDVPVRDLVPRATATYRRSSRSSRAEAPRAARNGCPSYRTGAIGCCSGPSRTWTGVGSRPGWTTLSSDRRPARAGLAGG